jgi:hypothetical protein
MQVASARRSIATLTNFTLQPTFAINALRHIKVYSAQFGASRLIFESTTSSGFVTRTLDCNISGGGWRNVSWRPPPFYTQTFLGVRSETLTVHMLVFHRTPRVCVWYSVGLLTCTSCRWVDKWMRECSLSLQFKDEKLAMGRVDLSLNMFVYVKNHLRQSIRKSETDTSTQEQDFK